MMSFTRRQEATFQYFNYNINGVPLQRVNFIRDLGVLFDSKLNFNSHIDSITKRAYKMLGFISRSLNNFKRMGTYCTLYNLYVRSILEYCSPVWCPHYQSNIDSIERVQKKFTRLIFRKFHYPTETYNMRLIRLDLQSLENRRLLSDELMLFRIKNGLTRISVNHEYEYIPVRQLRHNRLFYLPFVTNNVEYYST